MKIIEHDETNFGMMFLEPMCWFFYSYCDNCECSRKYVVFDSTLNTFKYMITARKISRNIYFKADTKCI